MTPPDPDLPDGPDGLDDDALDADEMAVHAVLDGEADAEQRRRVARDPVLVAQVAALRALADEVGADVAPPPDDVLARMRARALDALDTPDEAAAAPAGAPPRPATTVPADGDDRGPARRAAAPGPAPERSPTGDDLATRRARRRRARGLPPLPAVAAVVLLLVLFGGFLIATDLGGSDADTASDSAGSSATSAEDATGGEGGDGEAAADGGGTDARAEREELAAEASTSFADESELLDALRTVDPETLDLAGTGSRVPEAAQPSTTTAPSQDDDGVSESGDAPDETTAAERSTTLAVDDPVVQRCDTVLRSTGQNIEPAVAATMVLVDGQPVLVLSNPISATSDEEASVRLSTFDPLSCVPGDAVQRDPG